MLGHACGEQDDANYQGDEQAARLWIIHVPSLLVAVSCPDGRQCGGVALNFRVRSRWEEYRLLAK
jgi:hypothetical protein